MIRMIQSSSGGHAKSYFSDALSKSDYYIDDQELASKFHGRLAERLQLEGIVTKEKFFALCENVNPNTGEILTQRTVENRTVGYDINFHCPKSVSLIHALSKDTHILDAFQKSVTETMQDIERDSKTRIRKKGQYDERETGELLWADFIHQTARPVDGLVPDPHLHAHCFTFNATWDKEEQQLKAVQFRDIKRDMPYYQARFHKRLSDELLILGYQIKRTDKSFEIEGVPQHVIDLFSKRTDEIGRAAKQKGITDSKGLDALGARTRSKKQKGLTMTELKSEWRKQIQSLGVKEQGEGERVIRHNPNRKKLNLKTRECVDHALSHSFERASVVADRRLLESAYRFGVGDPSISVDTITEEFKQRKDIIQVKEKKWIMCTTKEVLQEEKRMVELARSGQGKLKPLYQKLPKINLEGKQLDAVAHVLTTSHRVSIIRGAAGTGKTTLMKEATRLMEKTGKKILTIAPTAQASRGNLREEGFENAETVAKFLTDKKLQTEIENQILWVDEAGLLGTKDMKSILEQVTQKNAQLILGGDTRQHSSVTRGDALRILNTVAGIKTAEVTKIYRQKNVEYREAVEALSKGKVSEAFSRLDKMGSIKEIDPLKPNETLIDDYLEAAKKGKSALIISPTHKQGEELTDELRMRLRNKGLIGKKEVSVLQLKNLNLTDAQKNDWRNLKEGQVLQFNQNIPGVKRGSIWNIRNSSKDGILLTDTQGNTTAISCDQVQKTTVFEKSKIGLSKKDKIKITKNGFDQNKKRLNNGQELEVVSVKKNGQLILRNTKSKTTYTLENDFAHLTHSYCSTSHAAQGKTVDEVFISQPASTFPATDAKQFYVSVSRAKNRLHIYTDDKHGLLEHACELGNRTSAIELLNAKNVHQDYIAHQQREMSEDSIAIVVPLKEDIQREKIIDRDYEPGF